jgi:parallel beta-helix repeat protein
LAVYGALDVNGTSGKPVLFTSAKESKGEGDWTGIVVHTGGVADIDYAVVKYAEEGVRSLYAATRATVTHSTFSDNQLEDMDLAGNSSATITVSDNTVTVGSGIGISAGANKATVTGNMVVGNASSLYGIEFGVQSILQRVSSNTVENFSNGSALYVLGNDTTMSVVQNTFQDSKYGIEVKYSRVHIGAAGSGSDANIITGNTMGIWSHNSTAKPIIRYNDISSNTYGVVASKGANPDLGTSVTNAGDNKLLDNATHCLWNRNTSGTIKAEGNYFGDCYPEPCWSGSVDVAHPLCSAPFSVVDVAMGTLAPKPDRLRLVGISPNPMRTVATIHLAVAETTRPLTVEIFDVTGRLVRDLGGFDLAAGSQEVAWDGRDDRGQLVDGGIYFIRIAEAGKAAEGAKVLVVR